METSQLTEKLVELLREKTDILVNIARLEERNEGGNKALIVATTELHRRLEDLNREVARIKEVLSACVPREVYDRGIASVEKASKIAADESSRRLDELTGSIHSRIDSVEKSLQQRIETVDMDSDRRLKVQENLSATMAGKQWIGGALVLILAAVIAVSIPLITKGAIP